MRDEMTDASMYALACKPGRKHDFDFYSGWCRVGCGNRSDGRVINMRTGDVVHAGPAYTEETLEPFRKRLRIRKR